MTYFLKIKRLNDSDRLALYEGIINYGLDGEEPDYGDYKDSLFDLIKPQIIANRRKRSANLIFNTAFVAISKK